jgi:general secretion pathway protein B
MSFILDALKKLEQKRRQGSVPDLTTVHLPPLEHSKKRPVLLYLFFAALLINAAILAVLLLPLMQDDQEIITGSPDEQKESIIANQEQRQAGPVLQASDVSSITEKNSPDEITTSEKEEPAASVSADRKIEASDSTVPEEQKKPVEPDKDPVTPDKPSPETTRADLGLKPSEKEIEALKNRIKEEQSLTDSSPVEETFSEEEAETAQERTVLELGQLPDDIRKELPDITIKGHIYSNSPSSRIANINGIITKEGDTVTSGLKVEEITMTGVIFDYGGFRFRIRAF